MRTRAKERMALLVGTVFLAVAVAGAIVRRPFRRLLARGRPFPAQRLEDRRAEAGQRG